MLRERDASLEAQTNSFFCWFFPLYALGMPIFSLSSYSYKCLRYLRILSYISISILLQEPGSEQGLWEPVITR